jgi:NADPH2:quinone reductase
MTVADLPEPRPAAGQVVVRVSAAGVNFRDVYHREGTVPGGEVGAVLGVEGAGTVVEAGPGVEDPRVGERVCWWRAAGSYAEQALVDAAMAIPIPDDMSDELAAASILQGTTARYLCTDTYSVRRGDTVLIHAVAGGVGLLLTQMVKARGGRVIGTTSTPEKAAIARSLGADEVIDYRGFADRVLELTEGVGAAVAYDGIGQATFYDSLAAVRTRGTMVLYGWASGPVTSLDIRRFTRSVFVTRPGMIDYTPTRAILLERADAVFHGIAEGSLSVRVFARYPLEEAARAHRDLQSRATTGKLVIDVGL